MALIDFSVLPRTTYAWKTALVNNFQYLLGLIVTIQTASSMKDMVKVATTANITLSGTQTIDGIAVVADDRVLVKNQTSAAENGPYLVKSGAWVRTTDGDAASDFTKGFTVKVEKGTVNADKYFTLTTDGPITLGTTELTFTVFDAGGATSNNTANKIVQRDGDGNFSAGTITADLVGDVTGNADTATSATTATTANSIASGSVFNSAEITGTGSSQNTAHGLGVTPSVVWAVLTEIGGDGADVEVGSHDATNAVFTVTLGAKYRVYAIK